MLFLVAMCINVANRGGCGVDGKFMAKGVDVMPTTDSLTHTFKDNFDVAVIVCGDQDHIKALEEVKREGKRVVLACFKSLFSAEIRQIADDSTSIDDISEIAKK